MTLDKRRCDRHDSKALHVRLHKRDQVSDSPKMQIAPVQIHDPTKTGSCLSRVWDSTRSGTKTQKTGEKIVPANTLTTESEL